MNPTTGGDILRRVGMSALGMRLAGSAIIGWYRQKDFEDSLPRRQSAELSALPRVSIRLSATHEGRPWAHRRMRLRHMITGGTAWHLTACPKGIKPCAFSGMPWAKRRCIGRQQRRYKFHLRGRRDRNHDHRVDTLHPGHGLASSLPNNHSPSVPDVGLASTVKRSQRPSADR